MEVNKAENQTGGWFRAGWRPFVGWVCGLAFANNFLIIPVAGPFLAAYLDVYLHAANLAEMTPVLLGMLGLATNRTVERIRDKA